ncbi:MULTISPECIES: hypothetical protein [Gordonia]|jgi:hypothetical protein|uniref:hypothetical protein n=1 Tax=Gordonia TaxID=2053 RepID=UPI000C7BECE0|nr:MULTISPECIES: hypothetical protein [Gordonia]AUH70528.1 hypothetical protein CXX93_19065 [Gordonia sp. YC-JH1]AUH70588.1 hypothetical protein CXX93_19435 [Gordonia sp. YC-JH1]WFN95126.1 hypothetical protein P5P27_20365 [Gordonia sihwensis]WFN95149.1 hypothetical protein P5P27_20505 [Gordonia sihwensis]
MTRREKVLGGVMIVGVLLVWGAMAFYSVSLLLSVLGVSGGLVIGISVATTLAFEVLAIAVMRAVAAAGWGGRDR